MFFTKKQKQDKLAKSYYKNYHILLEQLSNTTDDLKKEAINNAIQDIVDGFTLLRSSYDLLEPFKTVEDFRLLRVEGMPGLVFESKYIEPYPVYPSYYERLHVSKEVQPYLYKALVNKKLKELEEEYDSWCREFSIENIPFTPYNYDYINFLKLYSRERNISVSKVISKDLLTQFAHNNNVDIYISI